MGIGSTATVPCPPEFFFSDLYLLEPDNNQNTLWNHYFPIASNLGLKKIEKDLSLKFRRYTGKPIYGPIGFGINLID